jgi:hypothetical protein
MARRRSESDERENFGMEMDTVWRKFGHYPLCVRLPTRAAQLGDMVEACGRREPRRFGAGEGVSGSLLMFRWSRNRYFSETVS